MRKWELRQIFVRMEITQNPGPLGETWVVPRWGTVAVDNWDEADALSAEGWELTSSVPIIASTVEGATCTWGYVLFFKREIPGEDAKEEAEPDYGLAT